MNGRAQSLRICACAALSGFARILFLAFPLAVGTTFCVGQNTVDVTPRLPQTTKTGPGLRDQETEALKASVDLVLVPVIVTDQQDRPIMGLGETISPSMTGEGKKQ